MAMEWTARHETDAYTIQNIAWCIYIFFSFFSLRMRIEIASCNERALTLTFATFSHSLKKEKEWHAKRTKRNNSRTKRNETTQLKMHERIVLMKIIIINFNFFLCLWFVSLSSSPSPAYILWIEHAKNMTYIAVRFAKEYKQKTVRRFKFVQKNWPINNRIQE